MRHLLEVQEAVPSAHAQTQAVGRRKLVRHAVPSELVQVLHGLAEESLATDTAGSRPGAEPRRRDKRADAELAVANERVAGGPGRSAKQEPVQWFRCGRHCSLAAQAEYGGDRPVEVAAVMVVWDRKVRRQPRCQHDHWVKFVEAD